MLQLGVSCPIVWIVRVEEDLFNGTVVYSVKEAICIKAEGRRDLRGYVS